MPSLRRALLCLAAAAALAACHKPAPEQAQRAPGEPTAAPHAASAPDAGRAEAATRPAPSSQVDAMPTASDTDSRPPDTATGASQPFLLKDSGVRCVTFPCPSYSVQAPGKGSKPREVHELDLSALGSDEERSRVQQALEPGVQVEGTLSVKEHAGPAGSAIVLKVTRVLK